MNTYESIENQRLLQCGLLLSKLRQLFERHKEVLVYDSNYNWEQKCLSMKLSVKET